MHRPELEPTRATAARLFRCRNEPASGRKAGVNGTRHFILICAAVLILTAIALALLLGFGELGIGVHGGIALALGVLLTMAMAMGLMGLMFLSSRSGRDDEAHASWRHPDQDQ
jgi:hypothetical protein